MSRLTTELGSAVASRRSLVSGVVAALRPMAFCKHGSLVSTGYRAFLGSSAHRKLASLMMFAALVWSHSAKAEIQLADANG